MSRDVEVRDGSLGDVPGFGTSGVHAGLKYRDRDVALVVCDRSATAAAVYTTNRVQAAPIQVCRDHLSDGRARAIVVNSAVANACTGPRGLDDAYAMAEATADQLGIAPEEVLVASTGVIGEPLPIDKVRAGIREAAKVLDIAGPGDAAEAIMTTDTLPKQVLVEVPTSQGPVRIGGLAKGSGMIHPDMATMLAFLGTDAAVPPDLLRAELGRAVDATFNMITVDGDTSTNDMVAALAGGASDVRIEPGTSDLEAFRAGLRRAASRLAQMICRDGEGARTLLEVQIQGATDRADARRAARAVAASSLVKTAVFGADPNWGRILAAVGYSGADFEPDRVDIALANHLGEAPLVRGGTAVDDLDEDLATEILAQDEVVLQADLGAGEAEATAWGCDLSHDYVEINSAYRT